MKPSITVLAAILLVGAAAAAPRPAAAIEPAYEVYGSCATHKPFRPAHHCAFATASSVRATFVFESLVGKRQLKVCQEVTGVPLDKPHQCVTARGVTGYEAIPFHFTGIHVPIRVRVTMFARQPGATRYAKAGAATLRFDP
jgi:hypothetical protein